MTGLEKAVPFKLSHGPPFPTRAGRGITGGCPACFRGGERRLRGEPPAGRDGWITERDGGIMGHVARLGKHVAPVAGHVAGLNIHVAGITGHVARLSIRVATLRKHVARLNIHVATLSIHVARLRIGDAKWPKPHSPSPPGCGSSRAGLERPFFHPGTGESESATAGRQAMRKAMAGKHLAFAPLDPFQPGEARAEPSHSFRSRTGPRGTTVGKV